jgi:hypothetical protein
MILAWIAAMVVAQTGAGEAVGGEQFLRLMESQMQPVRDLALMYEGETTWVGPDGLVKKPESFNQKYQAEYAYRGDGSEAVDLYTRGKDPASVVTRMKMLLMGKELTTARIVDDLASEEVKTEPAGLGAMTGPNSIDGFLFFWLFRSIEDIEPWGYEQLGWEEVEGRRCLKVRLNWAPGFEEWYRIFWVDLERGGHPLKVEDYNAKGMTARLDRVILQQFPLGTSGVRAWLPVSGVIESFDWGGEIRDEPVIRSTMQVLDGSVALNAVLPDSVFKLDPSNPGKSLTSREVEGPIRKAYLEQPSRQTRVNMKGVDENIDRLVAEAEKQGEALEAPALSRSTWTGTRITQVVLFGIGAALLAAVLYTWRRTR